MKSRINATLPMKIIGYMIHPENIESLTKIALSFNSELNFLNESSANETIGFLSGFKGFNKSDETRDDPPTDQCLIFSGFNSKNIDKILLILKKNKISIPLKCVVTQHNQSWRLCDLIKELKKEHEKMNNKH